MLRRFVWPVSECPQESRPVKAPGITSDGNALACFVALFQLLLPKSPDFLILAFGDGSQRENFRPVDLMLAGKFPGAVVGRQFQCLVGDGAKWRITNFKQVARAMSKWA